MGRVVKAHDLLRVARAFSEAPAWVAHSLERAPFVVVRRASSLDGAIAVGIRGATRSERFGTWLDPRDVQEVLPPEGIRVRRPAGIRATLPAFALLEAIAPLCDAGRYSWGPTGSVGFELASGCETVTPSSDLDLLLRAPERLDRIEARSIFDTLAKFARAHSTRIDVQIETTEGAFSLAEFAHPGARVLLRCADGARLVADPWQARAA
jgi:phosphoribosyl-dephospho-CoA transferase